MKPFNEKTWPFLKIKTLKLHTLILFFLAFHANSANSKITQDDLFHSKNNDWTGIYGGGALGNVWTQNMATWNPLPNQSTFGINKIQKNVNNNGFIGAILIGYNYQFTKKLLSGIEADWSWTKITTTLSEPWSTYPNYTNIKPQSNTTLDSTLHWAPSLRGRAGYILLPQILVYGGAGVAWGNISYTASNYCLNNECERDYESNINFSKTSIGYVINGGLEWTALKNFLLRAEFLYYQFSSAQNVVVQSNINQATYKDYPSNYAWGNTALNTVRAGLIYTF